MKRILVGIKRVVDYNVRIRVKPDGSGVITEGVKMSVNPFDEIALEEALRIKERGGAEEVLVATVGPADCQQQLRTALAMGADRALHVQADGVIEPLVAARALLKLIEKEQRHVKLPDIMKAKKKPLETLTLGALGVEPRQQLKLVRFEPPPQRQKGIRVKDAAELVEALKKKGLL